MANNVQSYTIILDEHMHFVNDIEAEGYYRDIDHSRLDTIHDYWVCGTDANGREFATVYYKEGEVPSVLYSPIDSAATTYDDGYTFEGFYESETSDRRVVITAVNGKIYYARAITNSMLVYFASPYTSSIFTNLDEWYEKLKATAGEYTALHYVTGNLYDYTYSDNWFYNNKTVLFNTSKDTIISFDELPTVEVFDDNYRFEGYLIYGEFDYTNTTEEKPFLNRTYVSFADSQDQTCGKLLRVGESIRVGDINCLHIGDDNDLIEYDYIVVRPLIVPVNIEVKYYDTYNSAGIKELTLLETQQYTIDNFRTAFDSSTVQVPEIAGSKFTKNAWWLMEIGGSYHLGFMPEVTKDLYCGCVYNWQVPIYVDGNVEDRRASTDISIIYKNETRKYDADLHQKTNYKARILYNNEKQKSSGNSVRLHSKHSRRRFCVHRSRNMRKFGLYRVVQYIRMCMEKSKSHNNV